MDKQIMRRGWARLLRAPANRLLRALNVGILHKIECRLARAKEGALPSPPVFIIGPPRSGSTLLYQLMVDRYYFSYLTNVHALFFGAPSLVELVLRHMPLPSGGRYESTFGETKGWRAPSECGQFWYRFFPRHPQYATLRDVSDRQLNALRDVVRQLQTAGQRPLLIKNMPCALRLEPLIRVLPESLFVVTHRDLVDNAHSLLVARHCINGTYQDWWSLEPPGLDRLRGCAPHVQVVEQVREVNRIIEHTRHGPHRDRFLDVRYEDLCYDTHRVLDRIERFLTERGVVIDRRSEVPSCFSRSTDCRIDPALYQEVTKYACARAA